MSTIAEIDQAGRLVVPKKLRDALHLLPGTRVSLLLHGESIVIKPETPGTNAYQKDGLWVYHAADTLSADEVRSVIERDRDERAHRTARQAT